MFIAIMEACDDLSRDMELTVRAPQSLSADGAPMQACACTPREPEQRQQQFVMGAGSNNSAASRQPWPPATLGSSLLRGLGIHFARCW